MVSLHTDRLKLRDFKPEDFEAFYQTTQDPQYKQFYAEEETTHAFWQTIFERILEGAAQQERLSYQVAICMKSGELIGTCGVRIENTENQQASFGCAIARPLWGSGMAYEASHKIIDFGFSELPIHRIYAETISQNWRARMLLERLGMTMEGELLEDRYFRARWWNTAIYAVLKQSWENLHSP